MLIVSMKLDCFDVLLVLVHNKSMSIFPLKEYLLPQSPIRKRRCAKLSIDGFFLAPEIVGGLDHLVPCLFDQYPVLDLVDLLRCILPSFSYFELGFAVHVDDHFAELRRLLARPFRR